ncbi:MAG: hypothetical protein HC890_06575 [Chloroflexaceae bacterium]|nr:hypothetical protein [Chloroflexaceae bacterium]
MRLSEPDRLVIYHKHPSSGRTLFLRLNGSICHFERLSPAAQVIETESDETMECPSALMEEAEAKLGLTPDLLIIHGNFAA